MNAQELFKAEFEGLNLDLNAKISVPEGRKLMLKCMQGAFREIERNCTGMQLLGCRVLFKAAEEGLDALDAVYSVPVIPAISQKRLRKDSVGLRKYIPLGVGAAFMLACAVASGQRFAVTSGQLTVSGSAIGQTFGLLALICLAAFGVLEFLSLRTRKDDMLDVATENYADMDKLKSYCLRQMRAIDANLPSFKAGSGAGGGASSFALIERLLSTHYSGRIQLSDAIMADIQADLAAQGLKYVEYSRECADWFTTQEMDETCTLEPAYVSVKDSRLVKQGHAGVRKEN